MLLHRVLFGSLPKGSSRGLGCSPDRGRQIFLLGLLLKAVFLLDVLLKVVFLLGLLLKLAFPPRVFA